MCPMFAWFTACLVIFKNNLYLFIYLFTFGHAARGILAPKPGIEPVPLAVGVQSPNHWTTREFPMPGYFLLDERHCEFYLAWGWIFLYFL